MRRALCLGVGALLVVTLSSLDSLAAIAKALSLNDLTSQSSAILTGRVESMTYRWEEEHTMVFTYVDIIPDAHLKGSDEGKITLKLLRGILGEMATVPVGAPSLDKDEELLLFLVPGKGEVYQGYHRILGGAQGKFHIEDGIATRDVSQVRLIGCKECKESVPSSAPLNDFKEMIREHVEALERP